MSIQTKQSYQSFLEIRQQINASDAGQLADSAFMHYCKITRVLYGSRVPLIIC